MGPRRKVQPGRGSRAAAVFECLRASQGRRGTQQLSDLLKPSHLLGGGGQVQGVGGAGAFGSVCRFCTAEEGGARGAPEGGAWTGQQG